MIDSKLILITLLIKLGVAAAVSSALARACRQKSAFERMQNCGAHTWPTGLYLRSAYDGGMGTHGDP